MKVLLITSSDTFYGQTKTNSYNGVGWVASQQLELMKHSDIELGVMFQYPEINAPRKVIDGVSYFPICNKVSFVKKLYQYYFPIKNPFLQIKDQVEQVIADFNPDILHIYGLECPLADIISECNIPHIIHLQGIIQPVANTFFPNLINLHTIYKYGNLINEHILRNGLVFNYKKMLRMADREARLFKYVKVATGRTEWDRSLTSLFSPSAKYYHIDEILRPQFYKEPPVEIRQRPGKFIFTSTISQTIYKGLDLILKACKILDDRGFDYQWNIIGISDKSVYRHLIEKTVGYKASSNTKFCGVKKADEIVALLRNSDFYIHPSYIDNSPNSVGEAQLLGVPVIATNVGGVSSMITDNITGILVPANDPYFLAAKIIQYADDYTMRLQLSTNGRKAALVRHDKDSITDKIVSLYKSLMPTSLQDKK